MNELSQSSRERLGTCDYRHQLLHHTAIGPAPYDYGIACGARDEDDQNKAFAEKKSDVRWPDSDHNFLKFGELNSRATDLFIWLPEERRYIWGDEGPRERQIFIELRRYLEGVAVGLNMQIQPLIVLSDGTEDLGHIALVY